MKNRKQTSTQVARLAGKALADPRASARTKTIAASALAQTRDAKQAKRRASTDDRA